MRLHWPGRLLTAAAVLLAALAPAPGAPAALAGGSTPVQAGVAGSDFGLYVKQDTGPFTGYGGILTAAPAVVSVNDSTQTGPGVPIYLATGSDHQLYVRSQAQGWQLLSSGPTYCIDNPAGVVVSAHAAGQELLTVACQGSDHALWYGQETIGTGSLPSQALGFRSLGGVLVAGPAVAPVEPLGRTPDGELTFFADGTDGHVWTRTALTGWTQMPWRCLGHPAAGTALPPTSLVPSGEVSVFLCHGTDGQAWMARDLGSGWSPAQPMGGVLVDGPGLAVGPETATFLVEGTDSQLWTETITHGGNVFGWQPAGGVLRFGAGGAALLFSNAMA